MGPFDRAGICELIGLFLLSGLSTIAGKNNVGLDRDDSHLQKNFGNQHRTTKKKFIKFFHQNSLKIILDAHIMQANFLYVTFNLHSDKYWLYRKLNDQSFYIHSKSNHPLFMKKPISVLLANCLSHISCNQHIFNNADVVYQEEIQESGYNNKLYSQNSSNLIYPAKRKRKKRKFL